MPSSERAGFCFPIGVCCRDPATSGTYDRGALSAKVNPDARGTAWPCSIAPPTGGCQLRVEQLVVRDPGAMVAAPVQRHVRDVGDDRVIRFGSKGTIGCDPP